MLLLAGSLLCCNNPQPTALIEDDDPIEIEVITKNIAEPTSFGVDSTGLNENPARFTNVITVAGIKQNYDGVSLKTSFAQAVFFDRTKPVYVLSNRLIGYNTTTPGIAYFNNKRAEIRQLIVKYGVNRDTSLGLRYVLHRRANLGDLFDFEFNSEVNFRFDPILTPSVSFDISTPAEIFLDYRLSGKKESKNLNIELDWNAGNVKNFEIMLSIVDEQRDIVYPLYKIKTADDGKFKMPKNILEELAVRFNKIAFTLTRRFEKHEDGGNSELIVVSQSINTISVELP